MNSPRGFTGATGKNKRRFVSFHRRRLSKMEIRFVLENSPGYSQFKQTIKLHNGSLNDFWRRGRRGPRRRNGPGGMSLIKNGKDLLPGNGRKLFPCNFYWSPCYCGPFYFFCCVFDSTVELYFNLHRIFWMIRWKWGCTSAKIYTLRYLWHLLWDCPDWLANAIYAFLEPIILGLC